MTQEPILTNDAVIPRHFAPSRFEQWVWTAMVLTVALIALVIFRGDQLVLQITGVNPAPGAVGISTRTQIAITFDQPLAPLAPDTALLFTPPLAGELQVAGNTLSFTPSTPLHPYTTYSSTLHTQLRGEHGGQLREPLDWQFTTGGLQVAYIALDAEGKEQLYAVDAQLGQLSAPMTATIVPQPLTTGSLNVWDFTVSPSTGQIVYSAIKEDGTSDLHTIQPGTPATVLVPCPNAACNSAAWSPDGRLLAYSRRNAGEFGAAALNPPRLWLFDVATRETVPVFADNQELAFEPAWSADGAWLSYLSPDPAGIGIVNLATGADQFYASTTGDAAVWHPQQTAFVYSVLTQIGETYVTHLHLVDPNSGEEIDLSGTARLVEDNAPIWSPDGAWLAFRRKELAGESITPGKQIWRMRADGSDAEPLTNDPTLDHSQLHWSPDGRYLLFHKLPLKGPELTLSVWILDVARGESREIARPGQRPQWLP